MHKEEHDVECLYKVENAGTPEDIATIKEKLASL